MAFLTVFTPTYNRADTLLRTYESLCVQDCKDFIWLIIDDGSDDCTAQRIDSWKHKENGFEIQYIYKENGGMHTAHNTAYENIHTELNVCIDSDDKMAPGAVRKIKDTWKKIRSQGYAGMIALDADFFGNIIGKDKYKIIKLFSSIFTFILIIFIAIFFSYSKIFTNNYINIHMDYSLFGILISFMSYLSFKNKWIRIILFSISVFLCSLYFELYEHSAQGQFYSLLSIPIILLYNGKKGKYELKYFFYLYYPLHLVILYGINLLIS